MSYSDTVLSIARKAQEPKPHTIVIAQHESSGPGALSGWRWDCSCGASGATSLSRETLEMDASEHARVMRRLGK